DCTVALLSNSSRQQATKPSVKDDHTMQGSNSDQFPVPLLDVSRGNREIRDEILEAMAEVYDSGKFLHGPQVTSLEEQIAALCNTQHAVGCASGSDALLLALMALDIQP